MANQRIPELNSDMSIQSPTLKEIKVAKSKVASKITEALDEFNKTTGQNITDIKLRLGELYDGGSIILHIDFETDIDQSTNL